MLDMRRLEIGHRSFLRFFFAGALTLAAAPGALAADPQDSLPAGELLYNGIRLPSPWPPRRPALSLKPSMPPYLASPPVVIPIDVGRQLFVDDFLVERTTLHRTHHLPKYHPASPVLQADRPWEHKQDSRGPMAMPFSGGVWYDPDDQLFKMWYFADYDDRHLCYATSTDGIHWEKPSLDVVPGTNIVFPNLTGSRMVWLDLEEKDPARRYKLIQTARDADDLIPPTLPWNATKCSMHVHVSPDGIHWSKSVARTGPAGDRNSAYWNPFRKRWVFSIKDYTPFEASESKSVMRSRRYWESPNLITNLPWKAGEPPLWVGADNLDLRRGPGMQPQLYNLDAVAYESVLLGQFVILREYADKEIGRPKINEVCIGFSRDGFHWDRPDRRSFLPTSEDKDAWNWANVQSVGGGCLVVGDKLYLYASGRQGDFPRFHDSGGSTGLATLRRDGFASMDADPAGGTLTTRPLRFGGKHLFVNVDAPDGELRVEVLDENGEVLAPFSRNNCKPVQVDSTIQPIEWKGEADLSTLSGRAVRFGFHLTRGRLYSFWVSSDRSGASHGYVAAGGPGFKGPTDTVGINAYSN